MISIHAPHTGCDLRFDDGVTTAAIFQSTHPIRGATSTSLSCAFRMRHFNPRTPYGVRPVHVAGTAGSVTISIHAPHTGCDWTLTSSISALRYFNPRTPYGVRPRFRTLRASPTVISIHAPHTGCDCGFIQKNKRFSDIPLYFFFCGAVQAAHWTRKLPFKPHIRRTLAKRPAQQTADPALSRPKMRGLRPNFGANPSAILWTLRLRTTE